MENLVNPSVVLMLAEAFGVDKLVEFVEGRPLLTSRQRVSLLDIDSNYPVDEIAVPSQDSLDNEEGAVGVQLQLGRTIPVLQLAIQSAGCPKVKHSLMGMLDAAVEAHREIASYVSRPGEFNRSRASNALAEYVGLAKMAQDLAHSVKHAE
jgi:hypothetical protein